METYSNLEKLKLQSKKTFTETKLQIWLALNFHSFLTPDNSEHHSSS